MSDLSNGQRAVLAHICANLDDDGGLTVGQGVLARDLNTTAEVIRAYVLTLQVEGVLRIQRGTDRTGRNRYTPVLPPVPDTPAALRLLWGGEDR